MSAPLTPYVPSYPSATAYRLAEDRAVDLYREGVRGVTLRWAVLQARLELVHHLGAALVYRRATLDHAGADRARSALALAVPRLAGARARYYRGSGRAARIGAPAA